MGFCVGLISILMIQHSPWYVHHANLLSLIGIVQMPRPLSISKVGVLDGTHHCHLVSLPWFSMLPF
jgi:hypothetical protein